MPHITTYTGLIARNQASQPTDDFIKLGDIKGEFQVTQFPGEVVTGQANSDDSLAYAGSLFGEEVFKPQSIEDKGSVIVGDNHFSTGEGGDSLTQNETSQRTDDYVKLGDIKGNSLFTTGGGGDSITGEGRPMNIWTNGGASTFEDRSTVNSVESGAGNGDFEEGLRNDLDGQAFLREQFGVPTDNIDWTAATGGPGSSYLTETFEPLAGVNSFGESLNPVLEERSNWSELCDVGASVSRAELMPSFAIV